LCLCRKGGRIGIDGGSGSKLLLFLGQPLLYDDYNCIRGLGCAIGGKWRLQQHQLQSQNVDVVDTAYGELLSW
jgi:hypothetical protein